MYELIRTYGRLNRRSDRWRSIETDGVPLRDLQQEYSGLCFIITYPALQGEEQALFLKDVLNLTTDVSSTTTVQEWLTNFGNRTLPLKENVPDFRERYVKYINAWYGNYQLDPIGPSRRLEPDVSKYDKDDILIRHDKVDGPTLRKQAMVSINGFFHFTEYTDDGILVHYGNRSILHSNMNQIGIHSFRDVGEINYLRIDPDKILNKGNDSKFAEGVYVTLDMSAEELENKTVLFVFNGYLQVLGKGYSRVSADTFRIQLNNLMMLERYYQSREFMDMKDIPLTKYEGDEPLISVKEFHSDEMIRWLLLRSQTFFVIVDVPEMFHELEPLEHLKIPGRFLDESGEMYPVVGAYGRTLDYRRLQHPCDRFIIATLMNKRFNFDFNRQPWRENKAVNNGCNSALPFKHDHAYWRKMGTQD